MGEWSYVEWAEKAGIENLRGRLATGDVLLAQASTLLSLLLAGMGGALAYAVKLIDTGPVSPVAWAAAAVSAWLAVVAVVLMARCIVTRETQALYNEPGNIYKPDLSLSPDAIRGFELENIQRRIEQTKARNEAVARWLDRCRYAAIATPLVFAIAAWAVAGR